MSFRRTWTSIVDVFAQIALTFCLLGIGVREAWRSRPRIGIARGLGYALVALYVALSVWAYRHGTCPAALWGGKCCRQVCE